MRRRVAMLIVSLPLASVIPNLFGIRYHENTILFLAAGLVSWPIISLLLSGIVARIIGPPRLEIL